MSKIQRETRTRTQQSFVMEESSFCLNDNTWPRMKKKKSLLRILYFLSSFSFFLFAVFVFNTLPSYLAQASLKLPNLLAQLPKYWHYCCGKVKNMFF